MFYYSYFPLILKRGVTVPWNCLIEQWTVWTCPHLLISSVMGQWEPYYCCLFLSWRQFIGAQGCLKSSEVKARKTPLSLFYLTLTLIKQKIVQLASLMPSMLQPISWLNPLSYSLCNMILYNLFWALWPEPTDCARGWSDHSSRIKAAESSSYFAVSTISAVVFKEHYLYQAKVKLILNLQIYTEQLLLFIL